VSKRRARGEGTIYQRPDGLWAAQITLLDGKRKTKYGKTQREVKEWLLEKRKELAGGLLIDDKNVTAGEFLDKWLDIVSPRLRPATLATHETIIRVHIKPALENLRLSQITPAHLQTLYSQKLKDGLSRRTVKYIHTIIHQMLDQALKWGLVARNVSEAVDAPTPDKKQVEPLTRDEVKRLLEVLKGDRLYAFYVVALATGLRRGELLALTWDNVDLDNDVVYVRKTLQSIRGQGLVIGEPKSEKSRRPVVLPDFAHAVLTDHKAKQKVQSRFVFCTSKGTPFGPRNIMRHFKKMLKKAELPNTIRIHDLRHTFVSFMLSQNVPPKDVQVIAGHASFSTTMDIYGHLMPGAQREAAKKVDKMFEDV
jgi:integrase